MGVLNGVVNGTPSKWGDISRAPTFFVSLVFRGHTAHLVALVLKQFFVVGIQPDNPFWMMVM